MKEKGYIEVKQSNSQKDELKQPYRCEGDMAFGQIYTVDPCKRKMFNFKQLYCRYSGYGKSIFSC